LLQAYDTLLGQFPNNAYLLAGKGTALAKRSEWQRAADCLEQAVEFEPKLFEHHEALALLKLHLGQAADFQEHCRRILRQFESKLLEKPDIVHPGVPVPERLLYLVALEAPELSAADRQTLLAIARLSLENQPLSMGIYHYLNHDHAESLKHLPEQGDQLFGPLSLLLRSQSQLATGDVAAATTSWQRAKAAFDQGIGGADGPAIAYLPPERPFTWIAVRHLLDKVEAKLRTL
jgi:tetratricopeptide (TPR) repeat protein